MVIVLAEGHTRKSKGWKTLELPKMWLWVCLVTISIMLYLVSAKTSWLSGWSSFPFTVERVFFCKETENIILSLVRFGERYFFGYLLELNVSSLLKGGPGKVLWNYAVIYESELPSKFSCMKSRCWSHVFFPADSIQPASFGILWLSDSLILLQITVLHWKDRSRSG